MNSEEVIYWLNRSDIDKVKFYTAVGYAIEALKAHSETCGNLVDKKSVMHIVNFECGKLSGLAKTIQQEINMLPSEKLVSKWIPCNKKLPEKYGWYLCTYKDGRVNTKYWNNGKWIDNIRKNMFELYDIRSKITGEQIHSEQESVDWSDWIIAWMPLPEPYEEEKE